jgi:hypothetical protein
MTARSSGEIAQVGLRRPAEVVAAWIASPVIFAAAAFLFGFVFEGFRHPIAIAVAFLLGAVFPQFYLRYSEQQQPRLNPLPRWAWVLIALVVLTVVVLFIVSPSFIGRMLGLQ